MAIASKFNIEIEVVILPSVFLCSLLHQILFARLNYQIVENTVLKVWFNL